MATVTKSIIQDAGEGIILQKPAMEYVHGRTSGMLKFKVCARVLRLPALPLFRVPSSPRPLLFVSFLLYTIHHGYHSPLCSYLLLFV